MAEIRQVDGLDVRPGQLLRHSSGVVVKVTGAAREKKGGRIVNRVQVERTDNGQRGYLELQQGQTFTVGAGLKPGASSPMARALKGTNPVDFNDPSTRKL